MGKYEVSLPSEIPNVEPLQIPSKFLPTVVRVSKGYRSAIKSQSKQVLNPDWSWVEGIPDSSEKVITKADLRRWRNNPNRKLQCVYCEGTYPYYFVSCPRCGEYKGLQPKVR